MIGVQVQMAPSPRVKAAITRAGIVKSIGQAGILRDAKPSAIKIYRPRIAQAEEQYGPDPYAQGWNCAGVAIGELNGWNDDRLFIETWNEPPGQAGGPDADKLILLVEGFAERCHRDGYKVAGFCFATGNPEQDYIARLARPGINWCGIDLLSMHGYWGKEGLTVWHARRFVKYAEWADQYMPPVVITEAGRDAIEGGQAGWRKCGISESQYRTELIQYRDQLKAHWLSGFPVVGSTPFIWAPNGDWLAFDMEPFTDLVENWEPEWNLVTDWIQRREGGGRMPEFRFGFKALAEKYGKGVVGEPVTEEEYDKYGNSVQFTSTGQMVYSKTANKPYFFAAWPPPKP